MRRRPQPTRPDPFLAKGWIALGRLRSPHGVKGLIRLEPFSADPEAVFRFRDVRAGETLASVRLKKERADKEGFLVRIGGVETPEAARQWSGKTLYVARAELPGIVREGEYYQADLIGLAVKDEGEKQKGVALAFHDYGAGPLLEIALGGAGRGRTILIPFNSDVVQKIDLKAKEITVNLADWL